MPSSETIELRKVKGVVGEKDDLPSQNPRVSLASRLRALQLRDQGVPELMHLYGAYDLNETLTFNAGEDYARCLYSDDTYLYVGTKSILGQSYVVKIDLETFVEISALAMVDEVQSLCSDGDYLYAALASSPGKVVKINFETFTIISTLTLAVGENNVYDLCCDGTYLYAGTLNAPAKIVKIDLNTFTTISTLTSVGGSGATRSIIFDGTHIYCSLSNSPGRILKIDVNTFTVSDTLMFDAGENSAQSIYSDGIYLYGCLITTPGKIVKIDLSTFTKISTLTLSSGANDIYSIFSDGTYLYAAVNTVPGKIVKVDLSTFSEVSVITLASGENNIWAVYSDGLYLYIALATTPGKIVRQYIVPSSALQERIIKLIDEQIHSGKHYVYPTLAGAIALTSSATAWTMESYTEIVPVDTIKEQFYLTGIVLNNLVIDSEYEINIATGAAASEVIMSTVTHETHDTNLSINIPISPPIKISSNTRVSACVATENAAADTCTIKLTYKT